MRRINRTRNTIFKGASDGNFTLEATDIEKDLWVMVTNNGTCSVTIEKAVNKASWVLRRIRKNFSIFFTLIYVKKLYPIFGRTHLEFASVVWNQLSAAEIKLVEGVQHRATGMVLELREIAYYQRLEKLGLTDLESRRKIYYNYSRL